MNKATPFSDVDIIILPLKTSKLVISVRYESSVLLEKKAVLFQKRKGVTTTQALRESEKFFQKNLQGIQMQKFKH